MRRGGRAACSTLSPSSRFACLSLPLSLSPPQALGRLGTLRGLTLRFQRSGLPDPLPSLAFLAPLTRLTLLESLGLHVNFGGKQLPPGLPGSLRALTELDMSSAAGALLPVRLHAPGQGGAGAPPPPRLRRLALRRCVLEGAEAATLPAVQGLERLLLQQMRAPLWLAAALPALAGLTALSVTYPDHAQPGYGPDRPTAEALLHAALRCGALRKLRLEPPDAICLPSALPPGGLPHLQRLQLLLPSTGVVPLWHLPHLRCLMLTADTWIGGYR